MMMLTVLNNTMQTTWHSFRQRWLSYLANILGLAAGFAFFILAMGYVAYHSHFDEWLPNYKHKYYYVSEHYNKNTGKREERLGPIGVYRIDSDRYPEIKSHVYLQFFRSKHPTLSYQGVAHDITSVQGTSSILDFLGLALIVGNTDIVDKEVASIVIAKSKAQQIFGDESPLNQIIELSSNGKRAEKFRVTGVFNDLRSDSHLSFDALVLMSKGEYRGSNFFSHGKSVSYLELVDGTDPRMLVDAMNLFRLERDKKRLMRDGKSYPTRSQVKITPITKLHQINMGKTYRYMLIALAILSILLLSVAIVNYSGFMLIATSRKMKEIALRKIFGLQNRLILLPFVFETLLCLLLALGSAVVMAKLFYQHYQSLLIANFTLFEALDSGLIGWLLITVLLAAVISLVLPTLAALKTAPAALFSGANNAGGKNSLLLPTYVIIQMVLAVVIVAITIGVYSQMRYQSALNFGFNQENILTIRHSSWLKEGLEEKLALLPGVNKVAKSTHVPVMNNLYKPRLSYTIAAIDNNFLALYQLKLIAGQPLHESDHTQAKAYQSAWWQWIKVNKDKRKRSMYSSDDWYKTRSHYNMPSHFNLLISESAVVALGFNQPSEAVGHKFKGSFFNEYDKNTYTVIGVIADLYHDWQVGQQPNPNYYQAFPNQNGFKWSFSIRWQGTDKASFVETVTALTAEHTGEIRDVEITWLDKAVTTKLAPQINRMKLLIGLALVVVLITALGLHFAVNASTERLRREMTIRKVFGSNNVTVLSRVYLTFLKPIVIANLIAWPVAYFALQTWLEQYNDRIPLTFSIFLAATAISLLVMILVVTKEAVRQAYSMPIDDLMADEE